MHFAICKLHVFHYKKERKEGRRGGRKRGDKEKKEKKGMILATSQDSVRTGGKAAGCPRAEVCMLLISEEIAQALLDKENKASGGSLGSQGSYPGSDIYWLILCKGPCRHQPQLPPM